MPGGDGTGPNGMGSRTGRGMGFCSGYNAPGYANSGFGGRAFGRGRGFRRFWNRFVPLEPVQPSQPTKEQEKQMLENDIKAIEQEKKALEQEMETVRKRLEEVKKEQ